jgi:hypothetical protein
MANIMKALKHIGIGAITIAAPKAPTFAEVPRKSPNYHVARSVGYISNAMRGAKVAEKAPKSITNKAQNG